MPAVRKNFERSLAVLSDFCDLVPDVALPDHPYDAAVETIVHAEGAAAFRELIESGRARELTAMADRTGGYVAYATLAIDYIDALRRRTLMIDDFERAFKDYDAIVAPTLVWQAQHGWPQLVVLHDAAAAKNVVVGPFAFYAQQILMMNPLAAPMWIAGLVALVRAPQTRAFRWYGIAYVILSGLYLVLGAKVYYLAPIYPVLFAAGAATIETQLARVRFATVAYPALLLVFGFAIAPEAYPLLPLPTFLRYEHVLDFRSIKMEKHPVGRVPQHFADMLGWNTLVASLARANDALSPSERREAVILTHDYGQASAIDFLGPKLGLPRAISGHNNYFLYGTREASGRVVLAVGYDESTLGREFATVERVGLFRDDYVLPDFNNLVIYKCTHPREPIAAWWPQMRRYI